MQKFLWLFRLKTELWDLVTSTITTSTPILPSGDYNYGGIFHFDANQCRASGKLSQERFFLTYYHSEKFCIEVTSHGEPMPSISIFQNRLKVETKFESFNWAHLTCFDEYNFQKDIFEIRHEGPHKVSEEISNIFKIFSSRRFL